jgi:hypothetical protein
LGTRKMQITNRFDKSCCVCNVWVKQGEGFANNGRGRWQTYCRSHAPDQIVAKQAPSTERKLGLDGYVTMPYEPANLPLLQAMPGAQWHGREDCRCGCKGARKQWSVSMADSDRIRVLEIADQLQLQYDPILRTLDQIDHAVLPVGLYEFQKAGVNWLSRKERALLGDEMGLGKTPQALVSLPKDAKVMVVCPNTLKFNWEAEAKKWRPEFKVRILSAANRGQGQSFTPKAGEIVIINYEMLPSWLNFDPKDQDGISKLPEAIRSKLHVFNGVTLIADECFPHETQVDTEVGRMSIGEIVENQVDVRVLSRNNETGVVSFKRIKRFIRKETRSDLVLVKHEQGSFSCTGNHRIWTENRGYVRADDLNGDDCLRVVRGGESGEVAGTVDGTVLFPELRVFEEVSKSRGAGEVARAEEASCQEDMRELREGFLSSVQGEVVRRETVLQSQLFESIYHEEAGGAGDIRTDQREIRQRRSDAGSDWIFSEDEGTESYERSGYTREGEQITEWQNISFSGREWSNDGASTDVGSGVGVGDGDGDSDGFGSRDVSITSDFLQGGCWEFGVEGGDRGGRAISPHAQVEVSRSSEDRDLECSRVVSVAVQQSAGAGGRGWSGRGSQFVYNIEVEDNHNYFAEGVLVSNCHFVSNRKSQRSKKITNLGNLVSRVWFLTGTALTTSPSNLWDVLGAAGLQREAFGSFSNFCRLFHASKKSRYGGIEWGTPDASVPERLRRVMLRRTMDEVFADMPKLIYQDIEVNDIPNTLRDQLDAIWDEQGDVLEVEGSLPGFEEFSKIKNQLAIAKIPSLIEMIEEHEAQNVPLVVFSDHVAPVDAVGARPGWGVIKGDTKPIDRQAVVDAFQNGQLKGVACTITAGGTGLNLQRANKMIFCDLNWTPANNAQAAGRIRRIGQASKTLQVTRLVTRHPLERHIHNLIAAKIAMFDGAIDATVTATSPATPNGVSSSIKSETDAEYQARMDAILKAAQELESKVKAQQEAEKVLRAKAKVDGILTRERGKVSRVEKPITPERADHIRGAIRYLASVCDGAQSLDGMGFNKPDAMRGALLSVAGLQTESELRAAEYVIWKYRGQIESQFPLVFA